jgi:hypothetical protein
MVIPFTLRETPTMPIELESGGLQLTEEEIALYQPAAALVARSIGERIALHLPMTRSQFAVLFFAHAVVIGDEELMLDITAVIEAEIERRRRPH